MTSYRVETTPVWHCHENYHLALVFQMARAETRNQERFTEKTGSIFQYHSGEIHRYTTLDPVSQGINVELSKSFFENNQITETELRKNVFRKVNSKSLLLSMRSELLNPDTDSALGIESLLYELALESPVEKGSGPQWISILYELLHDHWDQSLTLQEISLILQIHPVTVSKNFRKYFACSLSEYRRRLRVEKGLEMILGSEKPLTEIAGICNFADQSHFTRNFRNFTGMTPRELRKIAG